MHAFKHAVHDRRSGSSLTCLSCVAISNELQGVSREQQLVWAQAMLPQQPWNQMPLHIKIAWHCIQSFRHGERGASVMHARWIHSRDLNSCIQTFVQLSSSPGDGKCFLKAMDMIFSQPASQQFQVGKSGELPELRKLKKSMLSFCQTVQKKLLLSR